MTNYLIAPSILSADFAHLGDQIAACESAGADWIHVDVMDGHFVPNMTIGPLVVEACKRVTKLPLDVHLMIEKPEQYLEAFAKAGASGLTVHVETCPHIHRTLEHIKSLGCRAGVTLNPGTHVTTVEPVLHLADLVLVLTVNPGFGGQAFLPETIGKITEIRRRLDALGSKAYIEVDGGIAANTLPLVKNAGANVFVAGNAVFKHAKGVKGGIQALRKAIG
ncbi:MAG: ribulose-phosphate 3-epimerase [Chloroflexota bacterium]